MKLFWLFFGLVMVAGISAYAGGLSDAIVEMVPTDVAPADNDGSLPGWVMPVVILAGLIGVAALASDGSDSAAS